MNQNRAPEPAGLGERPGGFPFAPAGGSIMIAASRGASGAGDSREGEQAHGTSGERAGNAAGSGHHRR